MTNEEFMQLAQKQKASAEYAVREQVKDLFTAVFIWLGLIAAGLVLLALLVFSFAIDVGPVAPTTVIMFLLVLILFNMK